MTDQTIPADKVREIVDAMRESMRRAENTCSDVGLLDDMSVYITDLVALFPTPPLPTLADMTASERNEHMWMQCEVEGIANLAVIVDPFWTKHTARVMWDDGVTNEEAADTVTPRPDLPRMTWPGDQYPEPEGDPDDPQVP